MNNAPLTLTVSQLNECVKTVLDNAPYFSNLYVTGEITNLSNHYKTGHIYFTLKDEKSLVKAVMFNSYTSSLKFKPENNMMVTVHARLSCFTRDGIYQLYVDRIEPLGAGALYIAFEQLKEKLKKEGLFNPEYKKPVIKFPQKIGIITSPTGAAVEDMKNIITRRYPLCEIVIYSATVQGKNAPAELIEGLDYFENKNKCDTIIIGRGGGSLEDLWCFNDEALAYAIFRCKTPVISAIGHETDFTICDFVSDLRAPTPSAAAELCVPDISQILIQLNSYGASFNSLISGKIARSKNEVAKIANLKFFSSPAFFFEDKKALLVSLEQSISNSFENKVAFYKSKLEKYCFDDKISNLVKIKSIKLENVISKITIENIMENKINALCLQAQKMTDLNPMAILSRGYSAVSDNNGKIVSTVKKLNSGDIINITMADGNVSATVNNVNKRSK